MRLPSNPTAALLIRSALGYAYRGWHVLPVAARGKRPLTKRGLLEASDDTDQVIEWWSRWPMANIGLRTGLLFDVLDIDGDEGRSSLLAKAGPGWNHSGPVSRTGKGEHWLFQPGDTANRAGLLPNVDWRGTNGYIVAPPSVHPKGHTYRWDESRGPDTRLPPTPEWLQPFLVPWFEKKEYVEPEVYIIQTNPHQPGNPTKNYALNLDQVAAGVLIDIVALAEEKGWHPVRQGALYAIHCPFHEGDNEASMKLYPGQNKFFCFGCHAWGNTMNLILMQPGGRDA